MSRRQLVFLILVIWTMAVVVVACATAEPTYADNNCVDIAETDVNALVSGHILRCTDMGHVIYIYEGIGIAVVP